MQKKTFEDTRRAISIGIPGATIEALERVAKRRDLPLKALLKLYVGQGLRNDLSQEESTELTRTRIKTRKEPVESVEIDLAD